MYGSIPATVFRDGTPQQLTDEQEVLKREIYDRMVAAPSAPQCAEKKETSKEAPNKFDALKRFSQVLDLVERYYVRDVTQGDLINGAVKGMGATNPAQAEPGTLRHKYGQSLEANAVHGSDAAETAAFEIGYFFSGLEITE